MPDRAVIFDLDGTLIDTVRHHAEAFAAAFAEAGLAVPADRIADEIGRGGDRLIPALLGARVADERGEALRDRKGELLRERIRRGVRVFDEVQALFEALRARDLAIAVATGSKADDVQELLQIAGLRIDELADVLITDTDVAESKPAPDAVRAAVEGLGLAPTACAMVGDTSWDVLAARRAGVATIGVTTGPHTAERIAAAGARAVHDDVADLLRHLDETLEAVFPGEPLTGELLDGLMGEALEQADANVRKGQVPIGAIVARSDGRVLARAANRVAGAGAEDAADGGRLAHAELEALLAADLGERRDLVLVSTLEPCTMCWGAAQIAGVDAVVYALEAPENGGTERVAPLRGRRMPRAWGGLGRQASLALLRRFDEVHDVPFVGRLLDEVG